MGILKWKIEINTNRCLNNKLKRDAGSSLDDSTGKNGF